MHADQLVPAVVAAVAVVCLLIAGRADGQDEYVPAAGGEASEEVEPQPAMPMPTNLLARPFMPGGSQPGAFPGGFFPQQPTNEPEPETKEEPEPETKEEPQPEQTEPEPVTPTHYQGDFYRTGVTPTIPEPRAMPTSPESWENFASQYIPKNLYMPGQQSSGGADNKQVDADGEPVDGLSQKAIDNILKEHNVFRAKEHVPPLTWNATVAQYAQHYANERKGDCALKHSTGPYGENLMYGQGKAWTWRHTVDEWSDEKKNYHYGSNTCDAGKQCGHYTAVVWKGTTAVGCGRVTCTSGDTLMVCSYYPPGNYDGEKPY